MPGNRSDDPDGVRGEERKARRLLSKMLVAFQQACDESELEIADQMLVLAGQIVMRPELSRLRQGRLGMRFTEAQARLRELRQGNAGRYDLSD